MVIVGSGPVPARCAADITALYHARFGYPAFRKKVFVSASLYVNGWETIPQTHWPITPAKQ
jgi:hypothetical protein